MWRIRNDVVFIFTLAQQQSTKGVAALGTSASKLYKVLDLLIQSMEVALSQDAQPNSFMQSLQAHPVGSEDSIFCSDIDNPFNTSALHLQQSAIYFNQDTIRDNFSAITLLIDQVLDGIGCPGGAIPNMLIASPQSENYLVTDMMKKAAQTRHVSAR